MGSGASKAPQQRQSLRHSESRVFDLAPAAPNESSIIYINSMLQDWVRQRRPRARSLPELSGNEIPQQLQYQPQELLSPENSAPEPAPVALAIAPLQQEALAPAPTSDKDQYKPDKTQQAAKEDGCYEDIVESGEDEVIDWKKGESIGSGSYGTVYLARNERTGSMMAVKEISIDEESNSDVLHATKEVELLRSLRHNHIVKYLGSYVDRPANTLHIFTEWVPGGNLEQQRKRFGSNEVVVRRFAAQILSGVAYLHSKNIVHQDIKPSNILIDQNGVVKLADFGASRLISSTTCVNNESMRGTPNYMAPEVVKQTLRGRKADIWSVGCSVLRMLTGLPFWGSKKFDSQIALLYYIANLDGIPQLPGELSPDASSFILSCLEIDPAKRPTAIELLQHPFVQVQSSKRVYRSPVSVTDSSNTVKMLSTNRKRSSSRICMLLPSNTSAPLRNDPPTPAPLLASIIKGPEASAASRMPAKMPPLTKLKSFGLPQEVEEDEMPIVSTRQVHPLGGQSDLPPIDRALSKRTDGTSRKPIYPEPSQGTMSMAHQPALWEEQPILTDAARQERENEAIRRATEKQKQAEREQKFQEELMQFRRQVQTPALRLPA